MTKQDEHFTVAFPECLKDMVFVQIFIISTTVSLLTSSFSEHIFFVITFLIAEYTPSCNSIQPNALLH